MNKARRPGRAVQISRVLGAGVLFILLLAAGLVALGRRTARKLLGSRSADGLQAGGVDPAARGISVFFPMYNDETTIERLVNQASQVLSSLTDDHEIWIINDGSGDRTKEIADRLSAGNPRVKVLHHPVNRGYGGALKSGFENAGRGLVFYTDGDGQFDIRELELLFSRRFEADVINGYKVSRNDSGLRKVLGKVYNAGARFLFCIQISDVDCDFRLIRKEALEGIELESESGAICLELVKKIQDRGFTFAEVPVHHYHRESGTSQFFTMANLVRMLVDLLKLYLRLVLKPAIIKDWRPE